MATKLQNLERKNKDNKAVIQEKNIRIQTQNDYIKDLEKENALLKSNGPANELKEARATIDAQKEEIENIKKKYNELKQAFELYKQKATRTSETSSIPPSKDGFRKPVINNRKPSEKSIGGQKGHQSHVLEYFEPTEIIDKFPGETCTCGGCIQMDGNYSRKQEVDIEVITHVIEERSHTGVCDSCGKQVRGTFSKRFINNVQYGPTLKSYVVTESVENFTPVRKIVSTIKGMTNGMINLSQATIINMQKAFERKIEKELQLQEEEISKSKVVHADETSLRINGVLYWIHTLSTMLAVSYHVSKHRGTEAIHEKNILPIFQGVLVCDHFQSYKALLLCDHAYCGAHILRELRGLYEIYKRKEIKDFEEFFLATYHRVKTAKANGDEQLSDEMYDYIHKEYIRLLEKWQSVNKVDFDRVAQTKKRKTDNYFNDERCLIERLIKYSDGHLYFAKDFDVPFDNNLAERDLRSIKTKQKVSGGHRSLEAAVTFMNLRSYVQQLHRKNELVFPQILEVFRQ